jgi:SpoVK/Ycf46/Vps4 family AAA+-type ATPase
MQDAGRLLVRDPPEGSAAAKYIQEHGNAGLVTYNELLLDTAKKCDNFSGAAIAGVARAAASHALERAVNEFSQTINDGSDHAKRSSINDCLVRIEDFSEAIADVEESMGDSDFTDDEKEVDKATDEITPAINNDDGERENE